jgi:hypothetical protein
MKEGRRNVCNINPVCWSRSNSSRYLALSLSATVRCSTRMFRLVGDNILSCSIIFHLCCHPVFSTCTDTHSFTGRPRPCLRPRCFTGYPQGLASKETPWQEGRCRIHGLIVLCPFCFLRISPQTHMVYAHANIHMQSRMSASLSLTFMNECTCAYIYYHGCYMIPV